MKKFIVLISVIIASTIATTVNAQNHHFKKVDGINNGSNCGQISAKANYQYINDEGVFGYGLEGVWNHKRLKVGADYIYAKKGSIDRSSASGFIGIALTGPRSKVRPIVLAHVGGASQSKYSAYKTDVTGSTPSADIEMNFIHLYKSYDWNLQTRLEVRVEWIVSNTITLGAFVEGICNPYEGSFSEASLKDVNITSPDNQHWEVNAETMSDFIKDNIFGLAAGINISVRF